MIEFKTNEGKTQLSLSGTFGDLLADTALFIKCMH